MLQYLVAFGLFINLDPNTNNLDNARGAQLSQLEQYVASGNTNEVFFIDNLCGPDIIYKHDNIVYLVQINFGRTISKQEDLGTWSTTNPNYFYCNRKTKRPIKEYLTDHNRTKNALQGQSYKRLLFLTTKGEAQISQDDIDDTVEVISSSSHPHYFDKLNPQLWNYLNGMPTY